MAEPSTESGAHDLAGALRVHGLRSTPQRRAILAAFGGGTTEHLSADQVVERSRRDLPDLGRGTVYATLGELVRVGLLRNVGRPDAVRYETNTGDHQHFRCLRCGRLYDLEEAQGPEPRAPAGFEVEHVHVVLEGSCADCLGFAAGLREAIARSQGEASPFLTDRDDLAVDVLETAVGPLTLAAGPDGLVRLAFDTHADAALLAARAHGRPGRGAAAQLAAARDGLDAYFGAEAHEPTTAVDWGVLPEGAASALAGVAALPYAGARSYHRVAGTMSSRELGRWCGENPVPVVVPCHRVLRGDDPVDYTGGLERKRALIDHERRRAERTPS